MRKSLREIGRAMACSWAFVFASLWVASYRDAPPTIMDAFGVAGLMVVCGTALYSVASEEPTT